MKPGPNSGSSSGLTKMPRRRISSAIRDAGCGAKSARKKYVWVGANARVAQPRRELVGPPAKLRRANADGVLVQKRGNGGGLARTGERIGVVAAVQVVRDRLGEHRVADPEPGQAVRLGQRADHEQVRMPRHEMRHRFPGHADERFVDQEARSGVASKQVGKRRHVEHAPVRVIGVHDHRDRRALRDLEPRQVEGEPALGRQPRFRESRRDLREQRVRRSKQVRLLPETVEDLAQDEFRSRVDVDEALGHAKPLR